MHTHEPHLVIPFHLQSSLLPFLFPSLLGCTDWLTDNMDTPRERERGKREREREMDGRSNMWACVLSNRVGKRGTYVHVCMYLLRQVAFPGGATCWEVPARIQCSHLLMFLFFSSSFSNTTSQQSSSISKQQQQQAASSDLKGTRHPCKNAHESGKGKV